MHENLVDLFAVFFSYINITWLRISFIYVLFQIKHVYQNIQHAECKQRQHFHFHEKYQILYFY